MPNKIFDSPWERQKGESTQAFAAFSCYLELGANRSLRAVSQELGKSKTLIDRWSRTHAWVERVRAWDNHLRQTARRAAEKEVRNMAKRHIVMAQKIQNTALQALEELGTDMVNPKNFAAVVRMAADLERQNQEAEAAAYADTSAKDGGSNLMEVLQEIGEIDTSDLPEVE